MPKVKRGRLDGLQGMGGKTAADLFAWADRLDAEAANPLRQDDPRWLRRWAVKIRHLAEGKERSLEHKDGH